MGILTTETEGFYGEILDTRVSQVQQDCSPAVRRRRTQRFLHIFDGSFEAIQ